MSQDAFTGGVKPGGLTSSTEIRILLCYLMHSVPSPLSQSEIETALVGEELVNYFELADSLHDICANGFAAEENGRYTLTHSGIQIASTLSHDVPLTVRETALRASLQAQQFAYKEAQHKAVITRLEEGCSVHCSIGDIGGELFSCTLYTPDSLSAAHVKQQFIERGDAVYRLMIAGLTGNRQLSADALQSLETTE